MRAELFYTTPKLKYPGEKWDQKSMYAVFSFGFRLKENKKCLMLPFGHYNILII